MNFIYTAEMENILFLLLLFHWNKYFPKLFFPKWWKYIYFYLSAQIFSK